MTSLAQARDAANAKVARLSDGDTAYHLEGDRGPWVVLVHGLVTPSYGWEPLAKALAQQGFRTLRYDHFGRGLSDRPSIRYNLDLYIRQLRELADKLSIESMHLVGWSMGGTIITRFAAEHPSRTDSLTLIAPGLYLRQPFIAKVLSRVPPARKIAAWRVRDVIGRLEKEHLSRPGRFPRYNERAREQLAFPGMGESFASTVANFAWDAGDEWSVVGEHPRAVLLVWGSADTVTPYRNAEKVMRLYPRATLLTVDAAKHAPHLDHPELVNPAVIEHLRSAERS
jgi:pimeloyl-ACP methyl ester carboxylesterase